MKEEFNLTYLFACLKKDCDRYGSHWYRHPGFWVVFSYRLRRIRKFGPTYFICLLPFDILIGLIRRIVSDTVLPSSISAGAGLYLPHPNGIIIHHNVMFGERVAIFQQVTVGEWHGKTPKVGNCSSLFPGAKLFGDIHIGSNCKIGANAVVNISIPDNTSVSASESILRNRARDVK